MDIERKDALDGDESFEREIYEAMLRREAPAGFTERVMARAAVHDAVTPARFGASAAGRPGRAAVLSFRQPVWRFAYAAAALLAVTAGTIGIEHHRTEQRRVDAAAAQFDEAMQVTGHALDHVSARLEQTGLGEVQRVLAEDGGK